MMFAEIITLTLISVVLGAPAHEHHDIVARGFWHHIKHHVEKVAHHVGHAIEGAAAVAITHAAVDVIVGKRDAALENTDPWVCLNLILEGASDEQVFMENGAILEDLVRHCEALPEKVEHSALSAIETSTDQSIIVNRGDFGDNFKDVVLNAERKEDRDVEESARFFLGGLDSSKQRTLISELQTLRERLIQWLDGHIPQTHVDHSTQNTTTQSNNI